MKQILCLLTAAALAFLTSCAQPIVSGSSEQPVSESSRADSSSGSSSLSSSDKESQPVYSLDNMNIIDMDGVAEKATAQTQSLNDRLFLVREEEEGTLTEPSLYGDIMVWAENGGEEAVVYSYCFSDGTLSKMTARTGAIISKVLLAGEVYWLESDSGQAGSRLVSYDPDTEELSFLSPVSKDGVITDFIIGENQYPMVWIEEASSGRVLCICDYYRGIIKDTFPSENAVLGEQGLAYLDTVSGVRLIYQVTGSGLNGDNFKVPYYGSVLAEEGELSHISAGGDYLSYTVQNKSLDYSSCIYDLKNNLCYRSAKECLGIADSRYAVQKDKDGSVWLFDLNSRKAAEYFQAEENSVDISSAAYSRVLLYGTEKDALSAISGKDGHSTGGPLVKEVKRILYGRRSVTGSDGSQKQAVYYLELPPEDEKN